MSGLLRLTVPVILLAGCTATQTTSTNTSGAEPVSVVERSNVREEAFAVLMDHAVAADPLYRANALEALAHAPSRAEPLALRGLSDPNEGVRSVAAMVIGRARLSETVHAVRPLLKDDSPWVRSSAIYALWRCGERVDPTPLAGLLLTSEDLRLRSHVAWLLGEMHRGEGQRAPSGMLRESLVTVSAKAGQSQRRLFELQVAEALVKFGNDEGLDVIRAALYASRPEELEATALAVQIIGQVGDRGAIDQLIYMSEYHDGQGNPMPPEIRLAVAQSLASLGLDDGWFIAEEYLDDRTNLVRAQAALVLGATRHDQSLGQLRGMLQDASGLVRVAAATAILEVTSER